MPTIVTNGKGDKASFWHSNWVNGQAPKYIASGLFQKAKRKNITVSKVMVHNKWISQVPLSINGRALGVHHYGND
jgi:hypothetical protein